MAMLRALALALSKMRAIRVQRPEQTYKTFPLATELRTDQVEAEVPVRWPWPSVGERGWWLGQ